MFQAMKEDRIYHIFCQGNDKVDLFRSEENKRYFTEKLDEYITPFADIITKCLMNNHIHILIRIKPYKEMAFNVPNVKGLQKVIDRYKALGKRGEDSIIISEMFRRLLMGYAKAINKMYNRTGSLFRKNFRRKLITSKQHLRNALIYIHRNPVTHNMSKDYANYKWSGYSSYLNNDIKNVNAKIIFEEIFGSKEEYIKAHFIFTHNEEDNCVILE